MSKSMRFNIKNQDQLGAVLTQIALHTVPENGWTITVADFKNSRSLAQQRFLFSQVYPPVIEQMAEATGAYVTKEQMHEFFKDMFSPRVGITVLGKQVYVTKSTTKFTKAEYSEYIEKIFAWGSKNSVWWEI